MLAIHQLRPQSFGQPAMAWGVCRLKTDHFGSVGRGRGVERDMTAIREHKTLELHMSDVQRGKVPPHAGSVSHRPRSRCYLRDLPKQRGASGQNQEVTHEERIHGVGFYRLTGFERDVAINLRLDPRAGVQQLVWSSGLGVNQRGKENEPEYRR